MYRRTVLAGVVLAGAGLLATGCGSGGSGGGSPAAVDAAHAAFARANHHSGSARAELKSAVAALGKANGVTASISVGKTAEGLESLGVPTNLAGLIAGVDVTVEKQAPTGKTLADRDRGGATSVTASNAGTDYVSVRTIDGTLYLKVDATDLLTALGATKLLSELQAVGPVLPSFLSTLLDGQWVSVSRPVARQAAALLGVAPTGIRTGAATTRALHRLRKALAGDTKVTRVSSGAVDVLAVSVDARRLRGPLLAVLGHLGPRNGRLLRRLLAHAPLRRVKKVRLTAQVADGTLSGLTVNLSQFSRRRTPAVPLDISLQSSATPITAPSGAVAITRGDLQALRTLVAEARSLGGLNATA